MESIRQAAVAGTFYPSDPKELKEMIESFYEEAIDQPTIGKVLIAPHAGLVYSGPIAASCYAPLKKRASEINKVILIGPSHYVGFLGMAVPSVDQFETPLGKIRIDKESREKALTCDEVITYDQAHMQEHSLEVHLPFLQESLGDFTLLPVVIGDSSPETVSKLLLKLWGDSDTLIIISTDLSHFMTYDNASKTDAETCKKIEKLDSNFNHLDACGSRPLHGFIQAAKAKNIFPKLIDLRNSGDTSGSKDRVVGYASFICDEAKKLNTVLSRSQQQTLIKLARYSIASKLGIEEEKPDLSLLPNSKIATFVTLKMNGELRGCIGTLSAYRQLQVDVAENALAAAFKDPRFMPLTAYEFLKTNISISLLTEPEEINFTSEEDLLSKIRPGVDGLILSAGNNRGTFLPSVWEDLPEKELFWVHLKRKAGLSMDYWSPSIKVERYTSVYISE